MSRVTFIGDGNMAAIVGGSLANGAPPSDITIIDPNADQRARLELSLGLNKSTLEYAGAIWEGDQDHV